jgi:hypothetical protein
MEIIEIITFHINKLEEVLEVTFRTNSDTEEEYREAKIPFIDIDDFGYNFHTDTDEFNLSDEYEDIDDDLFIDENEILSFLNEYYVLFTDKLPNPEFL